MGATRMPFLMVSEQKQQWGELEHGGGSSAQHSTQQADWGTAAWSNLFHKSDLLRLERRTAGPLYLLILTWDLVSAMESVDSVLASKDIQIVGARTS